MESKYKAELSRLRKKHEQQLGDYESQMDTLSRSNSEVARANKALAARVKVSLLHLQYMRIVTVTFVARSPATAEIARDADDVDFSVKRPFKVT